MASESVTALETVADLLEDYGDPETLRNMASSLADLLACGRDHCADKTISITASVIWMLLELAKKVEKGMNAGTNA